MNASGMKDTRTSRRQFLTTAAFASLLACGSRTLLAKADPEEEAIRGTDPDRRGPFRLGTTVFANPLRRPEDIAGFRLEGQAISSFPDGRLRLENAVDASQKQKSNFVTWMPQTLPESFAASWEFRVIREPGLCMVFFSANGRKGEDLFDPSLPARSGDYAQYHHGAIDAYHLSYFRRSKPGERQLQVCNLRKSYGFHLVAEGADPLPPVAAAKPPYQVDLIKCGPRIAFYINRLPILDWTDPGGALGPALGAGHLGFRQMAPLQAEYENFIVRHVSLA